MSTKQEMINELERLLTVMLTLRSHGSDYADLRHAQGVADGFMLALLDSGVATRQELLALVRTTRTALDGPGARDVHLDEMETAAA